MTADFRPFRTALLLAVLALAPTVTAVRPAAAQQLVPGVIFDMGGKFDKSFNESAYNGAERFRRETNIPYRDFEVTNEAQREQAMANMIRRGANLIIAISFAQRAAVERLSQDNPNVRFCLIDEQIDRPNVRSYRFKEHEGSFLVGMLAALKSQTGKVGFIGGMDIPLIRNFATGYEQGARHVNSGVEVLVNMTGNTPAAWRDPTRGSELARSQIDRGADVIYAAAGATGIGVLQTAADLNKFGIGVDSNQNHLHPGRVLTSMLKRVDNAVHDCLITASRGTWQPGNRWLGVAEDGVGWALDDNNRSLVTAEFEAKLSEARQSIIAGRLTVRPFQP